MKNFILTLTLLLIVPILEAQNKSIYFSIAMPSECTLDNNTKSLLKNKFFNLLSKEGVASMEYGAIAMIPEVNVNNSSKIAGGMRNIYSVELNITVTVRNIITNTVFNTLQIACNGEGYTEREAQRSAINRIDLSSPTYTKFIEMTKSKIETYYKDNISVIIKKANALASQQSYDEALALLSTYPESLPGYGQVAATMSTIFQKCQSQQCRQILLTAKAAYAQRDYDTAVELASTVDAQSECAREAAKLLEAVRQSANKEYSDQLTMEREKILSKERIKKAEYKAIADIASAYYQRQTQYVFFW